MTSDWFSFDYEFINLPTGMIPMASNAPIAVQDGQSTPVTHTFSGIKIAGDVAYYDNRAEQVSNARETLELKMNVGPKVRTVKVQLRVPRAVDETVNGVTVKTVKDFATLKCDLLVPLAWSVAAAKDARVLMKNLLAHAVIEAMSDTGEFVW